MEIAPKPKNEKQRIEALNSYNILDSLPEKEYDDITQLASFICDTPIALISLVDNDRQWFKSKTGLEVTETSRDLAFCAHAILEPDKILIVDNADTDERFIDNPLVTAAPNVKFYAGCPLNTPSGHSLGTLCVIDTIARKITSRQEKTLKILADNIVNLLELRKAKEKQKQLIGKLYSSNKELEQFAYVASHDLQEPLRVISSYVQLLSKRYKGKLDSNADKYIDYTVDGCSRMQALIEGLLKFSRIETNKNEMKWHCSHKILTGVMQDLQIRATERNAKVTWDELPFLYVDASQMSIVFQNLIKNGIKYNKNDSPEIKIHAEKANDMWVFKVRDNGIGVDEKFHDSIFKIFKRLHSFSEYTGTGIGLSICKKIIERHEGEISIESKPNEGSTFVFTLPAREIYEQINSQKQAA